MENSTFHKHLSNYLWPVLLSLISTGAVAQTWIPMGPAPIGENTLNGELLASTNVSGIKQGSYLNPAIGAMSAILPVPNSNIMFAGAVNGGVWKSPDNGNTWTPIGDNLASLSISTMTFGPSQNKIWVGFGHKSAYYDIGGYLGGLAVYDTSSGLWSAPSDNSKLQNQNITQIAISNNNIFVAAKAVASGTGIWVGNSSGSTFTQVLNANGLPNGDVTSIVQSTINGLTTVYAGLICAKESGSTSCTQPTDTGVYASTNNGVNWNKVPNINIADNTLRIMLATGSDGTVVTSILSANKISPDNSLVAIYRINKDGSNFAVKPLGAPIFTTSSGDTLYLYNGGQLYPHASLVVDPNNPNIIYIGGDTQPDQPKNSIAFGKPNVIGATVYNGILFKGTYDPLTSQTQWVPITNDYAANNSGPHADSRFLYLNAAGQLLEADDGGVYYRTNPNSNQGAWMSLNGNLQTTEMHTARWNSQTHTVLAAMQDNGTTFQPNPKSPYQYVINGGDGGIAEVNPAWILDAQTGSALYSSYTYLQSFTRIRVNEQGTPEAKSEILLKLNNAEGTILNSEASAKKYFQFTPTFALNTTNKTQFVAGGNALFVGQDNLSLDREITISVDQRSPLLNPEKAYPFITLDYGASNTNKEFALLAGTGDRTTLVDTEKQGVIYYSPNALTTDAAPIYTSNNQRGIQAVLFDRQYGTSKAYFTDSASIYRINPDAGITNSPTSMNGASFPTNFSDIRALTQIYGNGVSALVAGGLQKPTSSTDVNLSNYLYTLSNPATNSTYIWSFNLGSLPNAPVFGLQYSQTDDVVLANLMGRGAQVLYDATSYFTQADNLIFGKANNDSKPISNQLSNGFRVNADGSVGTAFDRSLYKYGTGTLDLTGQASSAYSGDTYLNGGTTIITNAPQLGTSANALQFNGGTLQLGANIALNRDLVLGLSGGTLNINGYSQTQSFGISGAGQFSVTGGGTLTLDRVNIQGGGLSILGGSTVVSSADNQLGQASSNLSLDNGRLNLLAGFTPTAGNLFTRPLEIGSGSGIIDTGSLSLAYTGGVVNGPGTLLFNGTPFTMGSNLTLNGYWGSSLTVPSSMTLNGIGGVLGNLTVSGTLAPGNSPGTMTVTGNVVQNPGSTLQVQIDGTGTGTGAGNYDRLVITGAGSTYTAGGTLETQLRGISGSANNNYSPPLGQGFSIVSAPGGILGSYSSLTQPATGLLPGTRFDAIYGNTAVTLYATPASYGNIAAASVATNTNRNQVGAILESIRPEAGIRESIATRKALFDALAPQTTNSLPVAMDQLGGVGYVQLIGMNYENTKFLVAETMQTVSTQRRGEGDHLINNSNEKVLGEDKEEVWGKAVGRTSSWQGDGTGSNTNDSLGGIMGGVQKHMSPYSLAGLSVSYGSSNSTVSNNLGNGMMQNIQVMGYGSYTYENGSFIQGSAGGGGGQINGNRNLSLFNTNYNALIYTGNLAANALAGWGTKNKEDLNYEGGIGLNYMGMRNLGFTDSGSQSAYRFTGNTTNNYSFTTSIGGLITLPFRAEDIDWQANVGVSLAHEFGDNRAYLNGSLLGDPLQLQSGAIGRDRLTIGAGVSGNVSKHTKIGVNVTNQSTQYWNATAVTASIRVGF